MAIQFFNHAMGEVSRAKQIPPTQWPHFDLFWVHAGRVRITLLGDRVEELHPGQGVLIFPRTVFQGDHLGVTARASVQHFQVSSTRQTPEMLLRLRKQSQGYERFEATRPDSVDTLIDRALELAALPQTPMVHDMRIAQLVLILGELRHQKEQSQVKYHDRLHELIEEIRNDPARRWTLEEMAQFASLSPSHFRAIFKQRTSETPGQFQLRARMAEAARLLVSTDLPIKQIAARLEFDQLPHFYRRFAVTYGVPPAEYRRSKAAWA